MRLTGLLIAAAVAAQSLAPIGPALVCRYTGKVLDPCACPAGERTEVPSVQAQRCCELRAATPSSPAIARAAAPAPSRPEPLAWAPPAAPPRIAAADPRAEFIAARPQAPPGTPRYLSIRTLLI